MMTRYLTYSGGIHAAVSVQHPDQTRGTCIVMAPGLPAACLASLVLADQPTPTLGFVVHSSAGRVRPRPCFTSGCSRSTDSDRHAEELRAPRVKPPRRPRTYSRPEIEEASVDLASLNLRVARAIPARRSWWGAEAAEQAVFHIHDMRMRCPNGRANYALQNIPPHPLCSVDYSSTNENICVYMCTEKGSGAPCAACAGGTLRS